MSAPKLLKRRRRSFARLPLTDQMPQEVAYELVYRSIAVQGNPPGIPQQFFLNS